ncbi:MAG: O-antigen ligase family protein [Bacteroidia bacterium]|nr:O-antigen ligase family protein [Bacteroidia bacterium]
MAGGMLFGTVPTSIPQIILFSNWLFEGNFKEKFSHLKSNKIFWLLSSVFLMHVLGLLNTTNMEAGLNDIRIKIPLMLLPLVFFSAKPLNKKELNVLLGLFITGIVLSSFWCIYYYYSHVIIDLRKVSRFMSHIRFGLFINMGICTLVYFIIENKKTLTRLISSLTIIYLLWFMLKFGLVTGIALFGLVSVAFIIYLIIKQNIKLKLASFTVLIIGAYIGLWFINSEWKATNFVDTSANNTAKEKSVSGRPYYKITHSKQTENGFYVSYNIQYDELYKGWPKLNGGKALGNDKRGNPLIWTLIRYMSSKGLTKDSVGLQQLDKTDIENIEMGIANYKYANASALRIRVKEFLWEYQDYKNSANPSGNTMLMRFEFWKAAVYIIQRNVWVGVGTGDAQAAFNKAYYRTETKLSGDWRLRSHNQFLAITVCFGVFGLALFVFSLFYPAIALRKNLNGLYFIFLFIALISFLTEDTLESQTGVTFYAYFNSLLLWLGYRKEEIPKSDTL